MNSSIVHARTWAALRPPSNDERRAQWAARFYSQGHHRTPQKPRVRVENRPQH
jgi:hypothetical protein